MPTGKLVKVGVWEDRRYIGVVLFGRGANNNFSKPYGLKQTEVCELVRIALTKHIAPVSRIVRLAVMLLRGQSPGLRLIVSYADPDQKHYGGIYQACGWLYVGHSRAQWDVMFNGRAMHKRTAYKLFGTIKGMPKSPERWKHKYLLPLDAQMRVTLLPHAKPYPKRPKQAMADPPFGTAAG
jgi:hypothetical protein